MVNTYIGGSGGVAVARGITTVHLTTRMSGGAAVARDITTVHLTTRSSGGAAVARRITTVHLTTRRLGGAAVARRITTTVKYSKSNAWQTVKITRERRGEIWSIYSQNISASSKIGAILGRNW